MGDYKNLSNVEAVEKMRELAESARICMFCTELEQAPFATRPMAVQEIDDRGNLWLISPGSSQKNEDIRQDDKVQLLFSHPGDSKFMSVSGTADIYRDRAKIEEIWTPMAKAWFEQGKDDPDVTIIAVHPREAYYWDTKDGKLVSLFKIAAAAVTGKPHMDGGVEGNLSV